MPSPYNPTAHEFLLSIGYLHTNHEASWEDTGDAENGPRLSGGPAFDEYQGIDDCVYIGEDGRTDIDQGTSDYV